jgi:Family of unknown function (DUF6855)
MGHFVRAVAREVRKPSEIILTEVKGTKEQPWVLKTPPGTSEYTMYKDGTHNPPILVCTVWKTVLYYDLRCINDLHEMLKKHGDWMELGSAVEQKPAKDINFALIEQKVYEMCSTFLHRMVVSIAECEG